MLNSQLAFLFGLILLMSQNLFAQDVPNRGTAIPEPNRTVPKSALSKVPTPEEMLQLIESYAKHRNFNGTVLVARNGQILVKASYGKAVVEWDVPSIPSARYRIGSLTKPLTATLVMILVQEGKLSLAGTLGEYLPELYANTPAASITIAQLLTHTSGISDLPSNINDPFWQTTARQSFTPMALAREWIKPVLIETPGEQFRYNNSGFYLLGLVIESVTGDSYAENLEQRLFKPVGMNDSGLFSDKIPLSNFALDYHRTPEKGLEKPPRIDPSLSYSAAGIYSTADDLYRFDRALYEEQLITAEMRSKMMTPPKQDGEYAYGWGLENWALPDGSRLPVSFHSGSVPGYQTYYLRSEPNQDCVIILNNFWQGSLVIEMGRELMHVLNGKKISLARSSFSELLAQVAHVQGHNEMVAIYNELADQRADYDVTENAMNSLGYKFLRNGRIEDAIKVFEWNTELYPRSANTHDSLGQVYRSAGRIKDAIRSYETALAIDPQSQSAANALKEMNTDGR